MRGSPALARPAASLAALLALVAPARAETAPGYVLNPPGGDTTRQRDEGGMSHLRDTRRRTPTGFLYPEPLEAQRLSPLGAGWLGRGSLEIGGMAAFGDDQETRFSRYADWSDEFLLDSFDAGVLHPASGLYLDARGGAVGRRDDYYSGEAGWLSQLRLRGTWSGIPHTYASDARNLFQGAGSEVLELPPPLVPGNNPDASVAAALAGIDESRLSVQRDELGLHVLARPLPDLRLFAGYERTARDGERPFGGSLVYATGLTQQLGRSVETTQPLDDATHEVSAGLEYGHDGLLGRLAYQGSFYRNDDEELTWENPFSVGPAVRGSQNVQRGRFALAPDNSWNNVKGEFMARMPLDGAFTTTVSWSYLRQDDDLLPFTVNSGIVGMGPSAVDLGLWNGSGALSRGGADAAARTLLVNGDLRLRPWRKLRLGARVRYYERDDETRYTAQNAVTGEIGYVAEDGALAVGTPFGRVFVPGQTTDDWRYASTPYGYDQIVAEGTADYALRPKTSLGLRYTWQRLGYQNRERERTDESRVRVDFKSREPAFATARLSYEYGERTGPSYDPDPYRGYYVSSLPGFTPATPGAPFTLPGLRKYDLADRRQQIADLKLNFLVREDMDLALMARYRDDDFDAEYGLRVDRRADASLEWSLQPSPAWGASLFASYERAWRRMKTVNDAVTTFPPQNTWFERTHESSVAAGASAWKRLFERVTLETSYAFILTRSRLDYDYASDGALSFDVTSATAGSRFPTLTTEDHVLVTSLRVELIQHVALRVFHLYQRSRIDDFQQAGLEAGVLGGAYYLGHVDRDYDAHAVGATVQLRF
jgi:MtrB/PioB family decaheme-associated outer membrane protein